MKFSIPLCFALCFSAAHANECPDPAAPARSGPILLVTPADSPVVALGAYGKLLENSIGRDSSNTLEGTPGTLKSALEQGKAKPQSGDPFGAVAFRTAEIAGTKNGETQVRYTYALYDAVTNAPLGSCIAFASFKSTVENTLASSTALYETVNTFLKQVAYRKPGATLFASAPAVHDEKRITPPPAISAAQLTGLELPRFVAAGTEGPAQWLDDRRLLVNQGEAGKPGGLRLFLHDLGSKQTTSVELDGTFDYLLPGRTHAIVRDKQGKRFVARLEIGANPRLITEGPLDSRCGSGWNYCLTSDGDRIYLPKAEGASSQEYTNTLFHSPAILETSAGVKTTLPLPIKAVSCDGHCVYLDWLGGWLVANQSKLINSAAQGSPHRLVTRDFAVRDIAYPDFLDGTVAERFAQYVPVKSGQIAVTESGLYLSRDQKAYELWRQKGWRTGKVSVSPSGCNIAFGVKNGRETPEMLLVLDTCKVLLPKP